MMSLAELICVAFKKDVAIEFRPNKRDHVLEVHGTRDGVKMFLCVPEKELHLSYGGAVCDPVSQIIEAHSGRAGFVKPEDLRDGVRYRFTYKGREYSGVGTNVVSTPGQRVAVIKIDQEIPGTAASGSLVDPEYLDTIWTE